MSMTDREAVAIALWTADGMPGMEWEDTRIPYLRKRYRSLADAAIAALDANRAVGQPTDAQILGSLVVPGTVDGT